MIISKSLNKNVEEIKKCAESDDLIFFNFIAANKRATAVFIDNLSDKEMIGKQVVKPLADNLTKPNISAAVKTVILPETEVLTEISKAIEKIICGDAVVFIDGDSHCFSASAKKPITRAVTEAPTSSVLKGPREGFVENLQSNLSLIRQRIKSPDLKVEKLNIGKYSGTAVALTYIKSIANDQIINEIRKRLNAICVDGITDSSTIMKCISSRKTTLFKESGTTEKPDVLAAKLLEGRVGIIVDGSPIAITLPYMLLEDFQSSEDYFTNTYRATFSRLLRLIAVVFAVLLPAVFVSAQLFHLQFIPLKFLLTIVNGIKGIPLSPSVEMFFTLLIFELLNEASIRMPKYVGIAMSVVGALVLGETAVNAGIVSTPTIMIVALSGICLYAVPDLTETLSVLRIIYLIVAGSMGGFGLVILTCGIITYVCSLNSFGVPYAAPYAPLILGDLKDSFIMGFYSESIKRPLSIRPKNLFRKGDSL